MAHINRRFIDKHWSVSVTRGLLAMAFGFIAMFGLLESFETTLATVAVLLLLMGVVDSVSALYASVKKHGWFTSVVDAVIDVATALLLLFFARSDIVSSVVILAVYTCTSGIIDIFHAFLSTVDPTDRFISVLIGILGIVIGFVILNSGEFELMTFVRFFGAYMLTVGVTSLIYGMHNRAQAIEDSIARKETAKARKKTKSKQK